MKQGTLYARRLKKVFAQAKKAGKDLEIPSGLDEPLRRMAVAILGVRAGDAEAERSIDRVLENMVDLNEVRVSTAREIQRVIGPNRKADLQDCQRLINALQAVYDQENQLSLDRLKSIGRRDARQFLEALEGVDAYAAASVSQWSLGGHGIPVDDRMLKALRSADLIHPDATRAEVQSFLERHVSAADAKLFCVTMRPSVIHKHSATKSSKTNNVQAKKKKNKKRTKV